MCLRTFTRYVSRVIAISLALLLLNALTAFAQGGRLNLRVSKVSSSSITIKWNRLPGIGEYYVYSRHVGSSQVLVGQVPGTSLTMKGLRSDTAFILTVEGGGARANILVRTSEKWQPSQSMYVPVPVTCRRLPSTVIVTGYIENTQCQLVDESGVGQMEVIKRGVIEAVDVWGVLPDSIEVCFRYEGWLAFLDADYSPRMAMELEHYLRDGMTCGVIDRAGTVALLAEGPSSTSSVEQEEEVNTLPLFESIPLVDCQIKLVETLYLRATPGGEIIGIVWLNTEVPALEINGYWYKVEFEGQLGYISRYHRKVLQGGCG